MNNNGAGRNGRLGVLWLLAIPFLVLWVPLYNRVEPTLFGFPFFYWFQLGWIFVSMIVTAVVYYATEPQDKTR
jgi:uncharacterized protein DUF3311